MSYAFKTKRDELLWKFVNKELQTRVGLLGSWVWSKWARLILISDTVRTFDEQKELNKKIIKADPTLKVFYPSVHNFGNGVDLSQHDSDGHRFKDDMLFEMRDWFNEQFPYSRDPEIKTKSALYHVGTAGHLHLQINAREHGQGINPNHSMSNRLLLATIEAAKSFVS